MPRSPSTAAPLPPAPVFPWASALVIALALIVAAAPALAPALLYERAAILRGEYWRLWTGHLVHFGASHLGWNLAVLAVAGIWCERLAPGRTRVLLALAPGVIGVGLYGLEPRLITYGGLSGLATALLTFLAYTQLARLAAPVPAIGSAPTAPTPAPDAASAPASPSDRWFWRAVLALIILKTAAEFAVEQPFFARYAPAGIRAVPLAHLLGILAATVIHRRRRSPGLSGSSR